MKPSSRPQHYRIRRMVQMVREGAETGYLPNSSDFMKEFEVSRRTVAPDLDFLRDEERAPLAYDDGRHGFRLTDETYTLPPVRISRKEAFSFGLARKLCPFILREKSLSYNAHFGTENRHLRPDNTHPWKLFA